MVQAACNGWEVLQPHRDVVGSLLQNRPAVVLRERLPFLGFPHWNQRRSCRFRAAEARRNSGELVVLARPGIPFLTDYPRQRPGALRRGDAYSFKNCHTLHRGKRLASDRRNASDVPAAVGSAREHDRKNWHEKDARRESFYQTASAITLDLSRT
jgi:hypothetical protein